MDIGAPRTLSAGVAGLTATAAILAALAVVTACGGVDAAPPQPDAEAAQAGVAQQASPAQPKLRVAATSNIVADWATQVGRDRVEVFSLLPVGADPHGFRPGARDIAQVADADLVLTIGLSLEAAWLDDLVKNAAQDPASIVELGEVVDPIKFAFNGTHRDDEEGEADASEDDDERGSEDPHFWLDPLRAKTAVNEIADRLAALDPDSADAYRSAAAAYAGELDDLHAWAEERIELLPPTRRKLVTSHDSFGYLADRYGLEIAGAALPGGATEREPSAKEIAGLIERLNEIGAPAIFTETTVSDKLSQQVVAETGAKFGGVLFTGSLSEPGGNADTYIALIRYNISTIVDALK